MKRHVALSLILILLLLQTGCWNAREIDELAFVFGIALDDAGNGRVKVTVQMAKPDSYSKSPTGGGTDKEKPFWIATSTGKTFFEAIRDLAAFSSRRIFWSHNKIIIIGEKLARRDISEILDFFSRNPELRLRTWIAVVPGNAGELLEKGANMENDPSTSIERIIKQRVFTGKGYGVMLKDFLEDYLSPATYPLASRISLAPGPTDPITRLEGTAVFSENRLVGWLDDRETRGVLWIKNKMESAIVVVPCPFDGKPLSIEITGSKTDFRSGFREEQPQLTIVVSATGNLSEQSCRTDFINERNLRSLENALASAINQDIQAAIQAAQKDLGLDFPGFNLALHRQNKKEWSQLAQQWPEKFRDMQIHVQVEANIPREALFARPLESEKTIHAGSSN